uniref:Neurotransmitter-gated ion-channel transmembrane domain-containing protein n=1 Tax=Plectus sambesii TaxID=2011161 RepID=A0A914XNL1_9BILA
MDLYADNSTVDLSIFLDNAEWELIGMTAARKVDFYNYGLFPILSYVISIKRKPFYYITNLVVPTVVLTVTALIGYHMPSAGNGIHQEKIKMGVTTILSIYILQLGVSDKLPRTSDVVPLLSIFYSCMVGLLSLAIIATSFVILVEKQGVYGKPPPNWVVRFILRQPTTVSQSPKLHASCSSLFRSNANCRQVGRVLFSMALLPFAVIFSYSREAQTS